MRGRTHTYCSGEICRLNNIPLDSFPVKLLKNVFVHAFPVVAMAIDLHLSWPALSTLYSSLVGPARTVALVWFNLGFFCFGNVGACVCLYGMRVIGYTLDVHAHTHTHVGLANAHLQGTAQRQRLRHCREVSGGPWCEKVVRAERRFPILAADKAQRHSGGSRAERCFRCATPL